MRNVIVTGANGFIGSELIKRLVDERVNVIALDVSFASSKLPESEYIQKIEIGLDDLEKLQASIPTGEYDAMYHFAWQGVNGPDKGNPLIQLKNIQMTMNCTLAAKAFGCKKFLCAGTIAERATESLPHLKTVSGGMMYGTAKYSARIMLETFCKNVGLDFVWMQFSNIYGPNNKTGNLVSYTIGELLKEKEATFGPALQPYDFIFVDDLIEAVFRLGKNQTKQNSYFIGSGNPRILKEYLLEIGQLCGRQDLIKIGVRPDDGIVYTFDMFDCTALKQDIGNYVSKDFTNGIRYTLENY